MDENKKKIILIIIILSAIAVACGIVYEWESRLKEKTKIIYPEELQQTDTIQKKLSIDKDNAQQLQKQIPAAQPTVTYYITSPTVEEAAEETAKQIDSGDDRLPKAALEKTDRTVVTPNAEKQKVDVYKVNLNKTHKVKAGVMTTGDKTYYGVGYQQGRWEGMVYTRSGKKIEAGSITYTVAEW